MPFYSSVFICGILAFLQMLRVADTVSTNRDGNFTCNACSYVYPNNDGISCLNNTNSLKLLPGKSLNCDNYCYTSEVWDKRTRQVKSLFRSCGNFVGNDCYDDPYAGQVNCKTSCKGDYCNNYTVDEGRIETLCERFQCYNTGLTVTYSNASLTILIISLCIVITAYIS
ncbi:uncharacterized protein LOC134704978 [Mytilus trossulus]|uniref:uncharacterized protein LOC134704978 n=1 Tax=Mytilus trossulus TaxID=6551 RepID=UPI0030078BFD